MVPWTEDSTITDALTTITDALNKADYQAAIVKLQSAKDQIDPYVYWYNLGYAQLQTGEFSKARYSFEKSRYLTLYSDATEKQLDQVREKLSIQSNSSLKANIVDMAISLGPIKLWCVNLLFIATLLLLIKKTWGPKKIAFTLFSILAPCLALIYIQTQTIAAISFETMNVFEGPSEIFATGRTLQPGLRFLGWKDDNWIKVYDENSQLLWISQEEMKNKAGLLWGE
ncbi:MAG: hypothetical protein K2P81_12610 [Bacteriovoracaceae bacterium]|nr:hypothetical protein [Bacteriovoracaceae bacterium]